MEQLKSVIYRYSGLVRLADGVVEELALEVSAPEPSGKGDSVCRLSCPFVAEKTLSIYGVDDEQALELSRRFVEASLEHMNACLVDADGNPVSLPPVPATDA